MVNNFDANYSRIRGNGDYYKLVMWSPLKSPKGEFDYVLLGLTTNARIFFYRGGLRILRLRGGYTMLYIAPLSRGRGVGGEVSLTTNARIFITAEGFATKTRRHKVSGIGFTQSSQGGKGAKDLFSFPPLGD